MANGLGRGLSSLIPKKQNDGGALASDNFLERQAKADGKNQVLFLAPDKIKSNPYQPRQDFQDDKLDELVKSIKEHGIIQPLVVSREGDAYELIAGERRLRAAKLAGFKEVPVILREVNNKKKLELALIENIQREDLSPIETAKAYQQLINEFGLKQEELALIVGKSRSAVANTLRFLKLPFEIQNALTGGRITEAHAKYLAGLDSETKQLNIFKKILHSNLSVRDTNSIIKKIGGTKESQIKVNYSDKNKELSLRDALGTKVEIRRGRSGGQILIDFYSDEELGEIIGKIV
jgi:ParB family chromosome partitioning protein